MVYIDRKTSPYSELNCGEERVLAVYVSTRPVRGLLDTRFQKYYSTDFFIYSRTGLFNFVYKGRLCLNGKEDWGCLELWS